MTYNLLGPIHGESSKHDYAPVTITKWTRRRDKLLDELKSINADIFCFQEMSPKALRETFIPGELLLYINIIVKNIDFYYYHYLRTKVINNNISIIITILT